MRILVDRSTVNGDEAAELLVGFAHHNEVEIISTDASDGLWWMELGDPGAEMDRVHVTVHMGSRTTQSAVHPFSNVDHVANTFPPSERESARHGLVLERAAQSAHCDAFATRNSAVLGGPWRPGRRSNTIEPEEAAALLGLHLRLRGDFTYFQTGDLGRGESGSMTFDRGLYYWVLTRALLPAGWKWFSACVASSSATGDEAVVHLGGSALTRVERTLKARDRLHAQFKVPQDANTMDEAHLYFDVLLLQLSGAFDAVARVAHVAHGMRGRYELASWRRPQWRAALASAAPRLAEMTETGKAARDTIELIALLRNTIHGEALQGVTLRRSAQTQYTFQLPPRDASAFLDAVARRGGHERWGIVSLGGPHILVSADRMTEAMFPDAVRALSRLMSATDVMRLRGAHGTTLRLGRPRARDGVFEPWIMRRLRLLAGL